MDIPRPLPRPMSQNLSGGDSEKPHFKQALRVSLKHKMLEPLIKFCKGVIETQV